MRIVCGNIILRDYVLSDVEDEVRWANVDTAWFRAEAPWMALEPVNAEELRADMAEILRDMPENAIRWRFEIEADGRHIGLVSSYYLNGDLEAVAGADIDPCKNAPENHAVRALGIEICEMTCWGRGIGTKALEAAMDYYRSHGENRFLLETWSGHASMLGCARKLGFREVKRIKGAHIVDGIPVDEVVLEKCFQEPGTFATGTETL